MVMDLPTDSSPWEYLQPQEMKSLMASDVDLALKFLEIGDNNINLMTKHEKQTSNSI